LSIPPMVLMYFDTISSAVCAASGTAANAMSANQTFRMVFSLKRAITARNDIGFRQKGLRTVDSGLSPGQPGPEACFGRGRWQANEEKILERLADSPQESRARRKRPEKSGLLLRLRPCRENGRSGGRGSGVGSRSLSPNFRSLAQMSSRM